ncbi:hypothetical protein Kpol_1039p2 [Vanderwaltozyma polyspora DSM 70294]|uniref:prephenate dehydratase n=1 Tax=Vanderwaltozyma polyspora (strain ATCC 22028 / DSM 70294 / BCRC 21397 / CBS 2163 / NBRC 10782 / NRRL Y-8283 / UCD 57-17) TaxID=436907 RepID=A7THC9_VANPO|nr:uncharacterized protein Kpol_1039p2 [Vanderwaltozyma polyspora DSM 70294]EDO18253.1 hypothetical protein Kpol_1039p2 [Vanderwaltozyma polyspora DSM 70294]
MSNVKVLFLGPYGTYSHQAALQEFANCPNVEYIPSPSINNCFSILEDTDNYNIDYSVVPLENSTNGQVVFSYDILRDKMLNSSIDENSIAKISSKIEIVAEQYVSISHCLISSLDIPSIDGVIENYKSVVLYSHPQVWGQIETFVADLRTKIKDISIVDTSSTSEAVTIAMKEQKSDNSRLHLSIASETAATIHNAHIIKQKINDIKGNTTRFLILTRRNDPTIPKYIPPQNIIPTEKVSILSFTINDDPGSLVDILTVLKKYSLNMCSINSRPYNTNKLTSRKWQYVFFVEFHNINESITDRESFYNEIDPQCIKWTIWGSFPRNERYYL